MGFVIKNNVVVDYLKEDGVTEVAIPNSVISIGKDAFLNVGILEYEKCSFTEDRKLP